MTTPLKAMLRKAILRATYLACFGATFKDVRAKIF